MIIDVRSADVVAVYRALIGVVTPRPIAWVTTVDGEGRVNLAPFSFFNAFGANPPVVVFSPVLRRDRSKKDTLQNLSSVNEFVLNAAVEELAEKVNALIEGNFDQLLQLLYRIDINEYRLRRLLLENEGEDAGKIIARLIVQRQWEKIESRRKYRQDTDAGADGEERW